MWPALGIARRVGRKGVRTIPLIRRRDWVALVAIVGLLVWFGRSGGHRRPPQAASPPSARAAALLASAPGAWITHDAPHARIHALKGSYAADRVLDLASRVEKARTAVLSRLDLESSAAPTLDVFYVGSRDDMRGFTGYGVTGFAWPAEDTAMLVYNADWRAFERHEFTHVIATSAWGSPAGNDPAVLEGLAVLVDGECAGMAVDRVVRTMDAKGLLVPLDRLLGHFRAEDDLVAYLQAGSLLGFVQARIGTAGLRQAWSGGMSSLPRVTGLSPRALERAWLSALRERWEPLSGDVWAAIRRGGCGISLP